MEYLPDGTVQMLRGLPTGDMITFYAKNIRPMPNGVHAGVYIFQNSKLLGFDDLNCVKIEERVRLTNRCHTRFEMVTRALYSNDQMFDDLQWFCNAVDSSDTHAIQSTLLAGARRPLKFLLRPYIVDGFGTIIYAPPGRGKSFLMNVMAVSCDAGVSTIWPVLEPSRVMVVNLERTASSVENRLYYVNRALGLPEDRSLRYINARGKTFTAIARAIRRDVEQYGVRVVFLDSLSRSGVSLRDDAEVNSIMDQLNALGCAWVVIGHTPKADDTTLFGSQMSGAAADIMVQVSTEIRGSSLGIGLQIPKANDLPPQPMDIIAFDFDQEGLAAVRRPRASEFAEVASRANRSALDEVLDFILGLPAAEATASQIAEALGRNRTNISHLVSSSDRLVPVRRAGREVFYGVRYDETRPQTGQRPTLE